MLVSHAMLCICTITSGDALPHTVLEEYILIANWLLSVGTSTVKLLYGHELQYH